MNSAFFFLLLPFLIAPGIFGLPIEVAPINPPRDGDLNEQFIVLLTTEEGTSTTTEIYGQEKVNIFETTTTDETTTTEEYKAIEKIDDAETTSTSTESSDTMGNGSSVDECIAGGRTPNFCCSAMTEECGTIEITQECIDAYSQCLREHNPRVN